MDKPLGEEGLVGRDTQLMRECFENDPDHGNIFYMITNAIGADDTNARLWYEASKRADLFDGQLHPETDSFDLQSITGGTSDPEAWVNTSARFMSRQGENYRVSTTTINGSFNLARQGEKESLFNLARYVRKMLFAKRFQIAAREILKERERRLREKFNMSPHDPILPRHRNACPYFNHLPLNLMAAYMKGDRDERVFSIEDTDTEHVGRERIQYASWAKGVKPVEE